MVKEEVGIVNPCVLRESCPHLNFQAAAKVLAEREYLSKRVEEMEGVMRFAEDNILSLQTEIKRLKEEKEALLNELNQVCRRPFKPNKKPAEESRPQIKRGAPYGHRGATRKKPVKIDEYIDVYPTRCKRCGGDAITVYDTCENHLVEDLEISVKTTCFRHHYGYCRHCQRVIYPVGAASEIAKSHIGSVARAVSGYLRYIGIPFRKTQKIFKNIFGLELTHPSLVGFDNQLAENGTMLYEQIKSLVHHSSVIHGDETGWRVDGINHWLWAFTNKELVLYRIERSRSSKVVEATLGKKYDGVIISDFYSAYNRIKAKGKQKCLGHLLAEVKDIEEKNNFPEGSREWLFCQDLKAVLKIGLETWDKFRIGEKALGDLKESKEIIVQTLTELLLQSYENKDIKRLRKRIIKHNDELLTFLDHPEIEPTNNRAERQLRPNVIMRKITFGNRSKIGARNHQVIMSIIQTAILNNIEPFDAFLSLSTNQQNQLFTVQKIRAP
jgi:hypothetical protein